MSLEQIHSLVHTVSELVSLVQRRENTPDASSGMGLLLPGAMAVGAAAAVGASVEQVAAKTPLQQPAKHWLDEPEDLGELGCPENSPTYGAQVLLILQTIPGTAKQK